MRLSTISPLHDGGEDDPLSPQSSGKGNISCKSKPLFVSRSRVRILPQIASIVKKHILGCPQALHTKCQGNKSLRQDIKVVENHRIFLEYPLIYSLLLLYIIFLLFVLYLFFLLCVFLTYINRYDLCCILFIQ